MVWGESIGGGLVEIGAAITATLNQYFRTCPNCGVNGTRCRSPAYRQRLPGVGGGTVVTTSIAKNGIGLFAAPDQHLGTGPEAGVIMATTMLAIGIDGCPRPGEAGLLPSVSLP